MEQIGILGGSFDPVHLGHLRAAVELRQTLGLDHVRLVPCAKPPHRAPAVAAVEQRLQMLQAAIGSEPGLVVDDREVYMDGPSYTVNTLMQLQEDIPSSGFCLALGLDAFRYLHTWYRWQQLFELANIVVLHRPGWDKKTVLQSLDRQVKVEVEAKLTTEAGDLGGVKSGKVCFMAVTGLEISSTRIRELVASGKTIRYLVPDQIVEMVNVIYTK